MTTFLCNQHLVFMPGLDGTGRSFDPLLSLLPPDSLATIVRYPTDRHLTLEETAQCAAEQIPAGTSPVVIAESFSGPVAVRMVASGLVRARALLRRIIIEGIQSIQAGESPRVVEEKLKVFMAPKDRESLGKK